MSCNISVTWRMRMCACACAAHVQVYLALRRKSARRRLAARTAWSEPWCSDRRQGYRTQWPSPRHVLCFTGCAFDLGNRRPTATALDLGHPFLATAALARAVYGAGEARDPARHHLLVARDGATALHAAATLRLRAAGENATVTVAPADRTSRGRPRQKLSLIHI